MGHRLLCCILFDSHKLINHCTMFSYFYLKQFNVCFSLCLSVCSFFISTGVSTSSTSLKRKADDAAGKGAPKKGAKAVPAKKAGSKPGPKKR